MANPYGRGPWDDMGIDYPGGSNTTMTTPGGGTDYSTIGDWGMLGSGQQPQGAAWLRGIMSRLKPGMGGDSYLRQLRALLLADAAAQGRSARSAARLGAPNDPSLRAWADLSALIGGQSEVSRSLAGGALSRQSELERRAFEERLLRLRADLEREAQGNGFWGGLGSLAGDVIGSFIPRGKYG